MGGNVPFPTFVVLTVYPGSAYFLRCSTGVDLPDWVSPRNRMFYVRDVLAIVDSIALCSEMEVSQLAYD